jgi:DNA polymerase III delta subunit
MHSKWKIWDFLRSRPNVLEGESKVIAFSCFDPLAFKILKERITPSKFAENRLNVMLGKEVTDVWFDDNFNSLGLFGNSDSYLIHYAEELKANIKEDFLKSDNLILTDRYVLLNFTKEDTFYKKLQKDKSPLVETIQIQAPAFWEEDELLSFICEDLKVYLTIQGKQFIREKVPFQINSYYQLIAQLKINYPDKNNIDVSDISPLISELKMDQFQLAELFGSKKLKLFYKKLIEGHEQGHELISVFYFLQSHLLKIYDLSYLDGKSKLTKYDKQIMAQSKLWSKNDLARAITYLGDLLILAKRKDFFFDDKIKRDFFRTMNF